MIKKITFLIAMVLGTTILAQTISQNVLATSGDYFQNGTASLSWTIGEPIINTLENGSVKLTQGFHQPYLSVSSIRDIGNNEIRLYPNPSNAVINIEFTEAGAFNAELYDVLGRKLQTFKINGSRYELDLSELAAGNYLLKLQQSDKFKTTTYKIQKIR